MNTVLADSEAELRESERLLALDGYGLLDSEPEQAYDDIVELACTVCDAPVASIALIDSDRQWFKASRGFAARQTPRSEAVCDVAIRMPYEMLEVRDLHKDARTPMRPQDAAGRPLRFYAGMPLVNPEGYALGAVSVLDYAPRALDERQRRGLAALARQVQHLFELRRMMVRQGDILQQRLAEAERLETDRAELQRRHDDLQRAVSRDPLTGLFNRAALEELRARTETRTGDYALAVVDIDHFKQVNDRYGHLIGDEVLRSVASVIAASKRKEDIAVRYGGEEFLLVLPGTHLAGAYEIAERIRENVTLAPLPFPVTVSVGIARCHAPGEAPERVFERADQALYRAKAAGRNRVVADDTSRL